MGFSSDNTHLNNMSVEEFKVRFPPNPGEINRAIASVKREGESSVVALARSLLNESTRGLRQALRKVSQSGLAIAPDHLTSIRMLPERRHEVLTNYAGIHFGVAILTIEDVLVNRELDAAFFIAEFNLAISGSGLSSATIQGDPAERLTGDQMRLMYQTVRLDPTFTSFFHGEGLRTLPLPIFNFIAANGVFPSLKEEILPTFRDRARLLI